MTFEQDYNKLIKYAEIFIRQKKLRIDAADLVNDAFIKHAESGREYFIGDIKSLIIGGSFKEQNHQQVNGNDFYKPITKLTSSYCKECKDDKPMSAFYLKDDNTILSPFGLCKECYIKKQLEHYYANKQLWLERSASYKEKNKQKIKIKKHEWYCKKVGYIAPIREKKAPKLILPKPIKFKQYKFKRKKSLLRLGVKLFPVVTKPIINTNFWNDQLSIYRNVINRTVDTQKEAANIKAIKIVGARLRHKPVIKVHKLKVKKEKVVKKGYKKWWEEKPDANKNIALIRKNTVEKNFDGNDVVIDFLNGKETPIWVFFNNNRDRYIDTLKRKHLNMDGFAMDVEDVVTEGFMQVLTSLKKGNYSGGDFFTWSVKIMQYWSFDYRNDNYKSVEYSGRNTYHKNISKRVTE